MGRKATSFSSILRAEILKKMRNDYLYNKQTTCELFLRIMIKNYNGIK